MELDEIGKRIFGPRCSTGTWGLQSLFERVDPGDDDDDDDVDVDDDLDADDLDDDEDDDDEDDDDE